MIAVLLVSACTFSRAPAPVSEQGAPLRQPASEFREVTAGDTLYSIAWESGLNYRELAGWNGIAPPYTILPGQRLRLRPSGATPSTSIGAAGVYAVKRGDTLFSIAARHDVAVADLAAWNNLSSPYTIKPGQKLRVTSRTGAARTPTREVVRGAAAPRNGSKPAPKYAVGGARVDGWVWPTKGALVRSSGAAKGIDVGGRRGQDVVAAASGTVVYQGSGLRGYGQLIIVKHNVDFLSAYAHCDKIVVREGDVIKRGQKIAEMGSTGTDGVKLHFEIRHRGTPVDPLDFLPKK
jgi:lipoprotein NlpD